MHQMIFMGTHCFGTAGKYTRLIQDYLGHRNIQHTVLYTATNSARFNSIQFNVN